MDHKQRTERLRAIMKEHRLSAADVGAKLDRTAQTVRSWRCAYDQRSIPPALLRLLEIDVTTSKAAGATGE